MRTKKQLPAADELANIAATKTADSMKPWQKMPRSCRLQFQNPATFEVTSVYLTRTDVRRYRVKIFKGGKCLSATYEEGDDFLEVLDKIKF